jgi:Protein of unknown function (DUF1592)/Protein of unknown function (DUF1588)/Protein of unknown function (DUF1595)/Protein of unknown function (DUF1585)/Protein of unknown function (DUF1587)
LAVCLLGTGCIGSIGDGVGGGPRQGNGPSGLGGPGTPGSPGGSGNTMPANPGGVSGPGLPGSMGGAPADPNAAGPQPLRRLDRREYNNTVRDLLGDTSRPADRFPSDRDSEFTFTHAGIVSSQDYSTIQDAAEVLSAAAEKNVNTLAPCPAPPEEACARNFAVNFGLRAYRRPLVDREIESLVQVYREVRNAPISLPHAGGIRLMIQAILQSPAFLYHWEGGPNAPALEGKVVRFDHYQNASQLSYFIWGSMPDGALFDAAKAGKLGTQAELEGQARRMLDDPKARETVSEFVEQWLGLDQVAERPKDPKLYPEFTDPLKQAMIAEARAFVSNVVFEGSSTLSLLLTANFGFVNQPLAAVYGMTGVQGMDLKRADLSADQRSGLLTQAAFLTVTGATDGSHPVKRGKKVFERLLCGVLPPPPADVPNPKPASAGGTTRQRFAEHSANACAAGCHANLDPLGFAFEHYDGIGKFRTMDNGGAVDASGSFELDGKMVSYQNARELVQALAGSETVRACFATQWLRYALRRFEVEGDRASLEGIRAGFTKTGGNIRDLMVGVVGARSFRYRAPADGEVLK